MSRSTVTDRASFVAGSNSQPFIVRNDGVKTVYLGQDSSLSVSSRDFTLTPGSSLNWGASTELWAICDAGETSALEWMYDSNTSFTPGPSNVVVSGAVTADQKLTKVGEFSMPVPAGAGTDRETLTSVDVSGAASVMVTVSLFDSLQSAPAPSVGDYLQLEITHKDFLNSSRINYVIKEDIAYYFLSKPVSKRPFTFHVPLYADEIDVALVYVKGASSATTYFVDVYTSTVAIEKPFYQAFYDTLQNLEEGIEFPYISVFGTPDTILIGHESGSATFSYWKQNSTTIANYNINYGYSSSSSLYLAKLESISTVPTDGPERFNGIEVRLPYMPISISAERVSGSGFVRARLIK